MILLCLWECLFQQTEILSNCLLILGYNKLLLQLQRKYVTVLQYLWMESVFTVELFHRLYSELLMTDYTNLLCCNTVPYTLLKHNKHHQNTVNIVNKRPTSVKRKHGFCWQGDLAKQTKRQCVIGPTLVGHLEIHQSNKTWFLKTSITGVCGLLERFGCQMFTMVTIWTKTRKEIVVFWKGLVVKCLHGDRLNQNKKDNCGPYIAQIGCCNYPI